MTDAVEPLESRLKARLIELRRDQDAGQRQLAALDVRAADLRETLLRIAGAIQVIEEALVEGAARPEPLAGHRQVAG
jgi:hypothetical protein